MATKRKKPPSPASLANLRPFRPGESGNPGGRPKRKRITEALDRALTDEDCAQIAQALIREAVQGDRQAFKEIRETLEGKLPLPIDHGGDALDAFLEVIRGGGRETKP